jgi:hypothetical protein
VQSLLACYVLFVRDHHREHFKKVFGRGCDPLSLFLGTADTPLGIQRLVGETAANGLERGKWANPLNVAYAVSQIFR